ncbi:MAG: polysaccharide deacetylase family protein [Carboxylicivirga sp.]|jgi:peptidoglycan/xylan/chitin deacetylase (PgdA/CDA1 family)|nr:polysaccharide deacetylase family protein [Carboxylicivirga sp.]
MLKELLYHIARILPFALLRKMANRPVIGINYHSIMGLDVDAEINKNVYRTKEELEADLQFLQKHYEVISPKEIIESKGAVKSSKQPKVFITLDDGLAIQYQHIVPILSKYNIKAIFFINPDFVDNKDLHYKRKVNYLIGMLNAEKIKDVEQQWGQIFKMVGIEPSYTTEDLYQIKYEYRTVLDQLAEVFQLSFTDLLEQQPVYLSSVQIKEMLDDGFYFGGHSMDHPNFKELNDDQQIAQSLTSIRWVVDRWNLPYALFAYPMNDQKISKNVINRVHQVADVSFGINGMMDELTPRHMPRITIEQSGKPIKQCLKYEYLRYLFLRLMNGKTYQRN